MAFHLQTNEHLDRGLRRILCQQIDAATKEGMAGVNGSMSRHVHRVRKHVKKMRAVLRLLRDEIGTPRFKVVNRHLRDMGRKISAVRDAQVRVRTVDKLCELFFGGRDEFPKIRRRLTRDSRDRARESSAAVKKIGGLFRIVRREVRSLKVSGLGPARLRRSLRRIYKQARAAFVAARVVRGGNAALYSRPIISSTISLSVLVPAAKLETLRPLQNTVHSSASSAISCIRCEM